MDLRPSNWLVERHFFTFQKWRISLDREGDMDRVTDSLYIGDLIDAGSSEALAREGIDLVFTLTARPVDNTDVHHPLKDGLNRQNDFDETVDDLLHVLQDDIRVLLHCAAGVSRGGAVATTAIAESRNISVGTALDTVRKGENGYEGRSVADPAKGLRKNIQNYLDSHE